MSFNLLLSQDAKENQFGGGKVSFNAEVYTYLERVQGFIDTQKYQDAVALFKIIAEKYSDEMIEVKSGLYYPLQANIQERIKKLPTEAYDLYMTEVNSIAKSFFEKGSSGEVQYWKELIDKYFISEHAGKACEQYADYLLDTGLYSLAIKYYDLAIVSNQKTISQKKWYANKVYAYAMGGQYSKANLLLSQMAEKKIGLSLQPLLQKLIAANSSKNLKDENASLSLLRGETMQTWVDLFVLPFDLLPVKSNKRYIQIQAGRKIIRDDDYEDEVEEDVDFLRNEWLTNTWFPVQQVGIQGSLYVFKKNDKLYCYDIYSNDKKWEVSLDYDAKSKSSTNYYPRLTHQNSDNKRIPNSESEILNFSDQIGSQVQVINHVIFTIIGHEKTGTISGQTNRFWSRGNQSVLPGNMLYGVDPVSGKKVFRLGHSTNKDEHFRNIVFLGLPVSVPHDRYGVVYNKGSEIFVSLVDKRGKKIWNKAICSYEDSYFMYTNNAKCIYENGYFYISTGYGLVAKIEAETGKYTWASKYTRFLEGLDRNAYNVLDEKPGLECNDLHVKNGVVYVSTPDAKNIIGIDGESGEFLFSSNEADFSDYCRYVISFQSDGILTCGEKGLRKYSYENLEELWTSEITNIQSRPVLHENCVIVPSENNLYVLNGSSGVKLKKFKLNQSDENFRLGNIFLIDELLLSVGFDGIVVCGKLSTRIESLTQKIDLDKDLQSVLYRGDLYYKLNDYKLAVADYFNYLKNVEDKNEASTVKDKIIESLYKAGMADDYSLISDNIKQIESFSQDKDIGSLYAFLLRSDMQKKNYKNVSTYCELIFKVIEPDKTRMLEQDNGTKNVPWLYALHLLLDVAEKEASVKNDFEAFILASPNTISMSLLMNLLELSDSVVFKQKLISRYINSLNGNLWNAKEHIFYRYLKKSDNVEFKDVGEYLNGLFLLEIGSFSEFALCKKQFLDAAKNLPSWFSLSGAPATISDELIEMINELNDLYQPEIKTVSSPPLVERYSFGDNLSSNILKLGVFSVTGRSEFLEKSLFYFNTENNNMFSVDLLTGKENWVNNFSQSNLIETEDDDEGLDADGDLRFGDYNMNRMQNLDMTKRSHDVASILFGNYVYAVDLISGKKVHKIKLDENEYHLNMSDELTLVLNSKTNELFAYSISEGSLLWSRQLKDSIGALKTIDNNLVVLDEGLKEVSVIDLKNGSVIAEKTLANAIDNYFYLEENRLIYLSRGRLNVCDLKNLKPIWTLNRYIYNVNAYSDQSYAPIQFTKTHYFVRTNLGELLKVDKETGSVDWNIKLPIKSNEYSMNYLVSSDSQTVYVENKNTSRRNYPFHNFVHIYSLKDGEHLQTFELLIESNKDLVATRNNINIADCALRGDVIPYLRKDGNNLTMTFLRKRDATKSNAFELKVNNFLSFKNAFFKGPILFFRSVKKVIAFGNEDEVASIIAMTSKVKEKFNSFKLKQ